MLQHSVYTSLSMFYTMPLNSTARITSMITCVSLCTPHSYKHLLLMQAKYVHKWDILNPLWVIEDLIFLITQQHHTTHHSIFYTQNYKISSDNCFQRLFALQFTVYHLTSTSTDANRTVIWWCILPKHICKIESLGICSRLRSVLHQNVIHTFLFYTVRHTFYISQCIFSRKFRHTTAWMFSLTSYVSHRLTILLWPHFLDAKINVQ
jgi:hypothetical protein